MSAYKLKLTARYLIRFVPLTPRRNLHIHKCIESSYAFDMCDIQLHRASIFSGCRSHSCVCYMCLNSFWFERYTPFEFNHVLLSLNRQHRMKTMTLFMPSSYNHDYHHLSRMLFLFWSLFLSFSVPFWPSLVNLMCTWNMYTFNPFK